MGDSLHCNITKCRAPLSDTAWVTRCYHLFCPEHGKSYFCNSLPQIRCPVCNETNVKETDITICELDPNDLVLAGLPPDKAIQAATNAIKLRKRQLEAETSHYQAQIEHLNKKNIENKKNYEKTLKKLSMKYTSDLAALKSCYGEAMNQNKKLTQDLEILRESKKKYQIAYNSMLLSNKTGEEIYLKNRRSPVVSPAFGQFDSSPINVPAPDISPSVLSSDNFLIRHFNV